MSVADFIAWLQQQDQGAIVDVVEITSSAWSMSYHLVEFDPEKHADYIDLRGNQHVNADSPLKDGRWLRLGGTA